MFELIHLIGRIIIMPTRTKDETQFFRKIDNVRNIYNSLKQMLSIIYFFEYSFIKFDE